MNLALIESEVLKDKAIKSTKVKLIISLATFLFLLSLLWLAIKQSVFLLIKRTNYSDHMASMFAIMILIILMLILSKKKQIKLSIFPSKFTFGYICASVIAAILWIVTPSNFTGGVSALSLLFYSCIVIPIFEELIFRGFIWNRLSLIFEKEWKTYLVSTILFALWHLSYISSIAFRTSEGLFGVMIGKVVTGLVFGIVLGAVRLKTKNCYSTILLHGVMNIFGR